MGNYYRGFRRIWIILWLITSSAVLVFICSIKQPNPAFPLSGIHPTGVQKPVVEPYEESSDNSNDNVGKWQRIANKIRKEEHEEQVQALSQWKSELISAYRINAYWKNVGFMFLALGISSALIWCVWAVGVWIFRGFKSESK